MAANDVQPDARRIGHGRGHSYHLDGKPTMGVTTIIKKGVPAPALIEWAGRTVAEYVISRRALLDQLTDDELYELARSAPYRERDAAANRGTEIHRIADK